MDLEHMPTRMKVVREELEGKAAIKVGGPFDSISDRVLEFTREIAEEGKRQIVLDLSSVSYMTSQGIACIIKVLKLAQEAGCALYVYQANPDMIELIRMARIEKYIQFI